MSRTSLLFITLVLPLFNCAYAQQAPTPPSVSSTKSDAMVRIRKEIAKYANERGETTAAFARRINSSPESIEKFLYDLDSSGVSAQKMLKSLEYFNETLKDPEKVKLLECLDIKVHLDHQPKGHPPSPDECKIIKQKYGAN